MEIKELLSNDIFNLPITNDTSKPFDLFIEDFFSKYLKLINKLDNPITLRDENHTISYMDIGVNQNILVKGLIKTIECYYNGFTYEAFKIFQETINSKEYKNISKILKRTIIPKSESFYRIRKRENNHSFNKKEMFHIPFEMRGIVPTQRFSIPGFPSLYLGNTLYLCWEELNRPQIDSFQAIRLENTKELTLIDLTTPPNEESDNISNDMYRYFMIWPLIACCSIKVKNESDIFKPEYIIPQLLLQYIRNDDKLDGIIYNSTHLTSKSAKVNNKLSNFVFPIKTNKKIGHCPELVKLFNSTEILSWQLYQLTQGGTMTLYNADELDYIDKKIPHLELIPGKTLSYSNSILGKLEYQLDILKADNIIT